MRRSRLWAAFVLATLAGDGIPAQEDNGSRHVVKSPEYPDLEIFLPTDGLPVPDGEPVRVAAITTVYFKYSHADDIITKFIEGYSVVGRIYNPHCKVVSLYVEQFPESDIGRGMASGCWSSVFDTCRVPT